MSNQQKLKNETELTGWINRQIQNGTPADFLPKTNVIHREETQSVYQGRETKSSFSHPPDRQRTREEMEALEKNRATVMGFRWEKDPEIEQEIIRQRTAVARLYYFGYNWWDMPKFGPVDKEPEHKSNIEIRNNYWYDDQSEWHKDDFFYLWDHALSKESLKPIPW